MYGDDIPNKPSDKNVLLNIDNKINNIKKKVRACMDRASVDKTIGEIHDLSSELLDMRLAAKIDFRDYAVREKQLRNAEGRVCVKGSAILDKLIAERDSKKQR